MSTVIWIAKTHGRNALPSCEWCENNRNKKATIWWPVAQHASHQFSSSNSYHRREEPFVPLSTCSSHFSSFLNNNYWMISPPFFLQFCHGTHDTHDTVIISFFVMKSCWTSLKWNGLVTLLEIYYETDGACFDRPILSKASSISCFGHTTVLILFFFFFWPSKIDFPRVEPSSSSPSFMNLNAWKNSSFQIQKVRTLWNFSNIYCCSCIAGQQQQMRALAFGHRPFPFSAADALGQAGACSLSALPAPLSNPFSRTKPGDPLAPSLSNLKVPGTGVTQG